MMMLPSWHSQPSQKQPRKFRPSSWGRSSSLFKTSTKMRSVTLVHSCLANLPMWSTNDGNFYVLLFQLQGLLHHSHWLADMCTLVGAGLFVAPAFVMGQVLFLIAFVLYLIAAIYAIVLDFDATECACADEHWVWLYVLLATAIPANLNFLYESLTFSRKIMNESGLVNSTRIQSFKWNTQNHNLHELVQIMILCISLETLWENQWFGSLCKVLLSEA